MEELIGKTILDWELSQDKKTIAFICAEGRFSYETEADCCNEVWFEEIEPPAAFPALVLEIKRDDALKIKTYKDWPPRECWEHCEDRLGKNADGEEQHSFYHIETNQGVFSVEVRNNHNGYYGGTIRFVG